MLLFLTLPFALGEDYDVSTALLKVSLEEGKSLVRTISISNILNEPQVEILKSPEFEENEVSLEINIPGVKALEEKVILYKGEKKAVDIEFDSHDLEPKVYIGRLKISGLKKEIFIPIIFEVESKDLFFDINMNIPPQYTTVEPGGKVVSQLKIFDLISGEVNDGLGSKTVNLDYNVYGTDGSLIHSETESIVVEQRAQLSKTIELSKNIPEGLYIISATARYRSSVGSSTALLTVEKPKKSAFFFVDINTTILIGLFLAFIIFILSLFFYLIKQKDKSIIELRRYHNSELKMQRDVLSSQRKILTRKGTINKKDIKKQMEKNVKLLKRRQKERVQQILSLKKQGKVKEMQNKINEWKNKGYNTLALEYQLKGIKEREMGALLKKWKEKGYKA